MLRLISIFLTIFLFLVSCGTKETEKNLGESDAHYRLGIEFAQYSLYKNSIDEFDLALKYDPSNIKVYNKKGLVYFGIKQYSKAKEMFQKVISLQPEHLQAHINLGMVEYMEDHKEEALKTWEKAVGLKENDNDSKALNNIGNVYKERGDYPKAIEFYSEAIRKDRKNALFYNNLAV